MNAISTYIDLGWGLLSHGLDEGGMHLIDAVFGAWILGMPLVILWTLGLIVADEFSSRTQRGEEARQIQAAMRRHPASQMSDAERRYHQSDQFGR